MMAFEKARQLVLEQATPLGREKIRIEAALRRVAAYEIKAKIPLPPFTNSAVDGYALRSEDTQALRAANPTSFVQLRLLAEQRAGAFFKGWVKPGTALKLMTGASVPRGADAVIPREEVEAGANHIRVKREVKKGENIRLAGEDIRPGQTIIQPGTCLQPAHLALMAAAGWKEILVYRQPKVTVIITGDELCPPGEPLKKGQIYDSNSTLLQALIKTTEAELIALKRVKDNLASLTSALKKAILASDIILTSGGVSVGDYDLVRVAAQKLSGRQIFWQVAQKPAKPLAFYLFRHNRNKVFLFGLPGNPGAVAVAFEEYVRPFIKKMMGRSDFLPREIEATLTHAVKKKKGRLNFLRVRLQLSGGDWRATSAGAQESGIISSLTETHGLALIPAESDFLPEGTKVKVHLLEW